MGFSRGSRVDVILHLVVSNELGHVFLSLGSLGLQRRLYFHPCKVEREPVQFLYISEQLKFEKKLEKVLKK